MTYSITWLIWTEYDCYEQFINWCVTMSTRDAKWHYLSIASGTSISVRPCKWFLIDDIPTLMENLSHILIGAVSKLSPEELGFGKAQDAVLNCIESFSNWYRVGIKSEIC